MAKSKILMVEDNAIWQDLIREVLGMESREIWCAANYREAKELLVHHTFDVAVVDIRLEDSDPRNIGGMLLLDAIAASKSRVPVILLTAYGTPELVRDAFRKYNVADFITKQRLDLKEFRQIVQQAIDQSKARLSDE